MAKTMINTTPTPQKPSSDECGIVATFSDSSLDLLTSIQSQLVDCLGDAIWLTPRRALHSTFMEIVCDVDYKLPRKQLFDDWYNQYNQVVIDRLAQTPAFAITFDQLEVSQKAIIARCSNPEIFNEIRSRLLTRIALPVGTKLPPDITHCSLARFDKSLPLQDVIDMTHKIEVSVTQHVTSFKLLKDLGPPTFQPKLLHKYTLKR